MINEHDFDQLVDQLLATPQHEGHPLREALARMRQRSLGQSQRMDRLARISDRYQATLLDLNQALQKASTHDYLTGLANRALLMERLREESARSARSGRPYVLAMLDADNFKQVNDTWGHETGDRVLVEFSRAMQAPIRQYDLCGRWGGEEFLLLLPETSLNEARPVIDRVHKEIASFYVQVGIQPISVTASIGISEHRLGENYAQTLRRADLALLEAKRGGRNQCIYGLD